MNDGTTILNVGKTNSAREASKLVLTIGNGITGSFSYRWIYLQLSSYVESCPFDGGVPSVHEIQL